jgi:hypothetical protein
MDGWMDELGFRCRVGGSIKERSLLGNVFICDDNADDVLCSLWMHTVSVIPRPREVEIA